MRQDEPDKDELRSLVSVVEDGIIKIRGAPVPTVFSVDARFDRVTELAREWTTFSLLVDLSHAHPPGPEAQEQLKARFAGF